MNIKELFHRLDFVSPFLPLSKMIVREGSNCLLPFYHSIGEAKELPHIRHLYKTRTLKEFEADLDCFLQYYQPVDLATIIQYAQTKKPFKQPVFHLTFDDGLKEVYEQVMPLLLKKGIPATIFLNSAFADNQALFFRYKASLLIEKLGEREAPALLKINYQNQEQLDIWAQKAGLDFEAFLQEQQPYLRSDQIQRMQTHGFTFGAHSVDHPHYKSLDLEAQIQQTEDCLTSLQSQFDWPFRAFAFPFSDDGVSAAFYEKMNLDVSFGTAGIKRSPYRGHLQRLPMEGTSLPAKKLIKRELWYRKFRP